MTPRHLQQADQPIRVGLLAFALENNRTGCGRMMVSLIRALCREDREMDIIPLTVGPLGPLADDLDVDARLPQDRVVRRWLSIAGAATRGVGHRLSFLTAGSIAASVAAQRLELDVLHDLTGIAPFAVPMRKVRRVLTIHDLVSYAQPGSNDYVDDLIHKRWLPRIAPRMDAVMTVSDTTKRDVVRYLGVPEAQVYPNQLGVDDHYRPRQPAEVARVLARHRLEPGYILFVGSTDPRKNLLRLLEACRRLWHGDLDVRLVIVGPANRRALSGAEAESLSGKVVWTGYVPESDLPAFYSGAGVLAFPSLYEGFGLPAVEAMRCAVPVVAGCAGSLPEVIGDAGILVDPTDVVGLAEALAKVLTDSATRAELIERGSARARGFTWSATAERAAAMYRDVAKPRSSTLASINQ
jgi:glycosyltransferase involved in cell wall biosynthesis